MGEGTTRVVEADGGGARVSALGEEISGVRERLDDLVAELDRRRHALRSWTPRPADRRLAQRGTGRGLPFVRRSRWW